MSRASRPSAVVIMCGLPASGKTTTAERLHAHAGGVLIRSCDVYQELGISLPDSVRRTEGFTRDVTAYEQARDAAYARMLSLLDRVDSGGPGPRCDLARRFPMASIPSGPTNWGSYAYTVKQVLEEEPINVAPIASLLVSARL